jgi:hypothetical protein
MPQSSSKDLLALFRQIRDTVREVVQKKIENIRQWRAARAKKKSGAATKDPSRHGAFVVRLRIAERRTAADPQHPRRVVGPGLWPGRFPRRRCHRPRRPLRDPLRSARCGLERHPRPRAARSGLRAHLRSPAPSGFAVPAGSGLCGAGRRPGRVLRLRRLVGCLLGVRPRGGDAAHPCSGTGQPAAGLRSGTRDPHAASGGKN